VDSKREKEVTRQELEEMKSFNDRIRRETMFLTRGLMALIAFNLMLSEQEKKKAEKKSDSMIDRTTWLLYGLLLAMSARMVWESVKRESQKMTVKYKAPAVSRQSLQVLVKKELVSFKTEERWMKTLQQRYGVVARRYKMAMRKVIRTQAIPSGNAWQKNARSKIQYLFNDGKRGGQYTKMNIALSLSEVSRAKRQAIVHMYKKYGVSYVYWRLSSQHIYAKAGGRKEACEALADGRIVSTKVVGDVNTHGLYPIDRFPVQPHPYCLCETEPLVSDPEELHKWS
jgi:hypothetical protein